MGHVKLLLLQSDLDTEFRNIARMISDLVYWVDITRQKLSVPEEPSRDIQTLTIQREKHKVRPKIRPKNVSDCCYLTYSILF